MQGIVYCIKSPNTDKVYVGSTTLTLSKRFIGHKADYKRFLDNKTRFMSSYDILAFDDAYIEEIEKFESITKEELLKKEGEYIQSMECVNRIIPRGFTNDSEERKEIRKEYSKKYYLKNRDIINENAKEYQIINHDIILERRRQYRVENRDKMNEHNREYRLATREVKYEAILEYRKQYRVKNHEEILERARQYRLANHDAILERARQRRLNNIKNQPTIL
jgi:hypothetical protein